MNQPHFKNKQIKRERAHSHTLIIRLRMRMKLMCNDNDELRGASDIQMPTIRPRNSPHCFDL